MHLATRPRVLAALATSAALVATGFVAAPAAQAGPPGHWTRLTTTTRLSNITEPSVVRFGGKLQVVWAQDEASSTASLRVRSISLAGAAGPTHTVVNGWSTLINDPAPFVEGGQLKIAFGGIRSTSPSEKYSGPMAYSSSADGVSWALGSDALSASKGAYGAVGMDAIDNGGTPLVAFTNAPNNLVALHSGVGPGFPASSPDAFTTSIGGCCQYQATLARDTKTHDVWVAWSSLTTDKYGIWVQKMLPSKGSPVRAPGSVMTSGPYKGNYVQPNQDIAMIARPGGGIWAAYTVGYPFVTKVRLWHVGTSSYHDFNAPNARAVSLGLGMNGRIWLAWNDPGSTGSIKAVRSNKTVSKFGLIRSTATPNSKAYGSVYAIAIDGTKGPLDVVVNADVPNHAYQALYHTQLYAPLKVTVSPSSVKSTKGGSVTVQVTEAGSAVAGAKVSFAGKAYTTNSKGKVTLKIAKHAATSKKTVTVSLTYYVTTKVTVRVT